MLSSFETSDGLRIAYHVDDFTPPWRASPTILMLHSAMGHSGRFYGMVPALLHDYAVVRMDLRGHGASEVPPPDLPLTMDRLVADTVELLDHLGLEAVHFVGNSAGGYVGQNLALSAPQRLRSLALFGSPAGLRNSQAASWLPRVAAVGLRRFLADTIADRFPLDRTDPRHVEWFLDEAAKNDTAFIGRFVGYMATLDWSGEVHRIGCPTLVVMPGHETVGGTENYDVMRDTIPQVKFVTLEGLPHNVCDAAPERCAEEVLTFLHETFGPPEPAHMIQPRS